MKAHYFYSIPCVALTCALSACSDDNESSPSKGSRDSSALTPAAASDSSAPVSADLVEKRAERLGIAALFPSEMSMMFGVYDVPGMIKGVQSLNMYKTWGSCSEEEQDDGSIIIPGEDGPTSVQVKSAVESPIIDALVGFGPDWAAWMDGTKGVCEGMGLSQIQGMLEMCQMYQRAKSRESGNAEAMDEVVTMAPDHTLRMLGQLASLVDLRESQSATAPFMVAAKLTPEILAQVRTALKDANLPEDMELHGIVSLYDKTYNGIACKVAEVDCKKLRVKLEGQYDEMVKGLDELGGRKMEPATQEQFKAAIKRLDESKLYVVVGFVDDTLVGFVTTNPEKQVRLAASPQDSVLSRPDFSMADAHVQYPAYGLWYVDKAAVKSLINMDIAYYTGVFSGMKQAMQVLGKDWKVADTAPPLAALDSIRGNVLGLYGRLAQNATSLSYYAWQNQGVHLEATMYPLDFYKLDAPSAMNAVRPGPATVLYSSATVNPQIVDMACSLYEDVSRIVWDYGNAYISDPANEIDDQVRMVVPMVQMARPTIEELWKAYRQALSGLTGATAFVMDMQGAPSPMLKNVPAPRFSLAYEVKDRAALGQAWQKVSEAAKMIITLASQGKMTELPAPKASTDGDITTYDYECPLGADLNPVVSVSDTRWAVSMPKAFGLDVIKESMKVPAQVAPLEIQLNLVPVRDALKKAASGNKDIQKAVDALDVITSDLTGVHATGRKAPDGRDVYHLHVISAGK